MNTKDKVKKVLAGLFFLVGVGVVGFVILTIGFEKGFLQPKIQIEVLFRDVGGLIEGAPVRLAGVNVGTVGSIDFLEERMNGRGVLVTLNIFSEYTKQVEKSSRIGIKTEGVLGQKLVEIRTSEYGKNVSLDVPIIGEDPLDVQDSAEIFVKAAKSLKDTSDAIKVTSLEIKGAALTLDVVMNELETVTQKFSRVIDRVHEKIIEGNLFKLF